MNTPSKTTEKSILLHLADKLMEAQREVNELTMQLALGKAEVREKYEEIKKEFGYRLINFKNAILNRESSGISHEIIMRIEQLEDRLAVGRVESKEMFVVQRKFILKALSALEKEVRKILPDSESAQYFSHEIENFKLKMEILRLRFVLKRFEMKDEIKSNVAALRRRVSLLIAKAHKKVLKSEKKIIYLNKDISNVF